MLGLEASLQHDHSRQIKVKVKLINQWRKSWALARGDWPGLVSSRRGGEVKPPAPAVTASNGPCCLGTTWEGVERRGEGREITRIILNIKYTATTTTNTTDIWLLLIDRASVSKLFQNKARCYAGPGTCWSLGSCQDVTVVTT